VVQVEQVQAQAVLAQLELPIKEPQVVMVEIWVEQMVAVAVAVAQHPLELIILLIQVEQVEQDYLTH
tara:strand:+ start:98 stop:298 length:201 start_codon:yes stop_codon:yes gene_type:complete